VPDAILHEQGGENIDVFLVAVHGL
jgi:hypothetical protein